MARIRSIKPEFWKSESIAQLGYFDRLLFIALWSYVDDNGVGRDIPPVIAGELFALEEDPRESLANVQRGLARLSEARRITRYEVEGREYLHITNWSEHQRIDKPNKARYPRPDDIRASLTSKDAEFDAEFAEPSRDTRDTSGNPRACPAPGAGSREQGAGSREETHSAEIAHRTRGRKPGGKGEPDGFAEWYAAYPRHVARKAAAVAYAKALREVDAARLLAAARRFADDPTLDPAFVPHPATWLNQGRWNDEGPARPASTANGTDDRHARNVALIETFRRREQQAIEAPEQSAPAIDFGGMFGGTA